MKRILTLAPLGLFLIVITIFWFQKSASKKPRVKKPVEKINLNIQAQYAIKFENDSITGDIQKALQRPRQVKELKIYEQNGEQVNTELINFPNLESLTLYNCDFSKASPELSSLSQLRYLTMESCLLKYPLDQMNTLRNLKYLDLSNNDLQTLPPLDSLQNLNYLGLGANPKINYEQIFDQLARLPKLEDLSLANNRIQKLSPQISNLPNLKALNLSNNFLRTLPDELSYCDQLIQLRLDGNRFPKKEQERIKETFPAAAL